MKLCTHILRNPYYPTGSVLAKQATNCATALWATLVLFIDGAMRVTAYSPVTEFVHEDIIAGVLLLISLVQVGWLCAHLKPRPFGHIGYAVQWVWWLGALTLIVQTRPLQITATMGAATVATLAAFAFASGPRSTGANDAESD